MEKPALSNHARAGFCVGYKCLFAALAGGFRLRADLLHDILEIFTRIQKFIFQRLTGGNGLHEPSIPGECSIDKAGCIDILTSGDLMSENVPGMAPNSTLVEIEKYTEKLIPGMRLETLLDRVNKEG